MSRKIINKWERTAMGRTASPTTLHSIGVHSLGSNKQASMQTLSHPDNSWQDKPSHSSH